MLSFCQAFLIFICALSQAYVLEVNQDDSIQGAIFAAQPWDTVLVYNGSYYEHIKIDKPITLKGMGYPILDSSASGSALTLSAGGVIIEGFRIINSGSFPTKQEEAGINVLSNNNTVRGNIINNNFNGILVTNAEENRIFSNIIKGNLGYGIKLLEANNNSVYGNILVDNYGLNAFDNGINKWDNYTIGNYFSDFDSVDEGCFDENMDMLCDSPHAILGGQGVDMYPLARIFKL